MYRIRYNVIQQALVVSDEDDGAIRCPHGVDARGDDLERIDIQSRVGFIQDGEHRFHHGHLQNLVPLLLPAREAFIDAAIEKTLVHMHEFHLVAHQAQEFKGIQFLFTTMLSQGVDSRFQEIDVVDTRDFNRILKCEKDTCAGALFRRQGKQVPALVGYGPGRNLVTFPTGQHVGQRALAGTVGAHDRVHFAGTDLHRQAIEDGFAVHRDVKVFYRQHTASSACRTALLPASRFPLPAFVTLPLLPD